MIISRSYPTVTSAAPEATLTIVKLERDHATVNLYTCLGASRRREYRHIHLDVPINDGAKPEDIVHDVYLASLARGAVGVTCDQHGLMAAEPAPHQEVHDQPPGLYEADRWAKEQELDLALPAEENLASLRRYPLPGFPGEWHCFKLATR
jgi:hypothetical protein